MTLSYLLLGRKTKKNKMNLIKALELVLNEAESSALGECSSEGAEVLEAVELIQQFYDEYGHQFQNYEGQI